MRKNRLITLLSSLTLAVAGIGAIAAGVSESRSAVELSAENGGTCDKIYFAYSSTYSWIKNVSVQINQTGDFQNMTYDATNGRWYYTVSTKPNKVQFRHDGVSDADCNTRPIELPDNCNGYYVYKRETNLEGDLALFGNAYVIGSHCSWSIWDSNVIKLSYQNNQWEGSGQLSKNDEFKVLMENTTGAPTYNGWDKVSNNNDQARYKGQIVNASSTYDSNIKVNYNGTYSFYYGNSTLYIPYITNKVSFNKNGGSGTDMSQETFVVGEAKTLSANSYTKTGHSFSGWSLTEGGAVDYNDKQNVTLTTGGTTTLYAVWSANTYNVNYNKGSYGTGSNQTDTKTYGVDLTLKGAIFTRDGYTQTGWATSDGGAQAYALNGSYTANSGTTLYPVWTKNTKPAHSVTYVAGSGVTGNVPTQSAVEEDSTFVVASGEGLTKTNYTFVGWNDGSNTYAAGATYTMGTSNVTLTSQWTENAKYTVTFKSDDGNTTLGTSTVYVGGTATFDGTPTKEPEGQYVFTFEKWVTTVGGDVEATLTNVQSSFNVYAKFIKTYSEGYYFSNFAPNPFVHTKMTQGKDDQGVTQYYGTYTLAAGDHFKVTHRGSDGEISDYYDGISDDNYKSALYAGQLTHEIGLDIYCVTPGSYTVYFKENAIYVDAIGNWFTLTLDDNGGEGGSGSISTHEGLKTVDVQVPRKDNSTFNGYYLMDNEGKLTEKIIGIDGKCAVDHLTLTENTTVYAKWTKSSVSKGEAIYLDITEDIKTGFNWQDAKAEFAAHMFTSGQSYTNDVYGHKVQGITDKVIYEFVIDSKESGAYFTTVTFVRMDPNKKGDIWTRMWNQSVNLGLGYGTNCFALKGEGEYGEDAGKALSNESYVISDEDRAGYYANYFLDTCTCSGTMYTFDDAKWDDVANEYSAMSDGAKTIFTDAEATYAGDRDVAGAAGRYDELVSKRGFEDFADRGVTPNSNSSHFLSSLVENNPSTWIIVVISLVGLSSAGVFFIYKKRKQN